MPSDSVCLSSFKSWGLMNFHYVARGCFEDTVGLHFPSFSVVCTQAYMWVWCMYVYLCTCMWASGDNLLCLHILRQDISLAEDFKEGDWLVSSIIHLSPHPSHHHLIMSVCHHTCFLYECLESYSTLHMCEANMIPTQLCILSPFLHSLFLTQHVATGFCHDVFPFLEGFTVYFPILLLKSPHVSQNKPSCSGSSHIRHLVMLVEAYWNGRSNCVTPQIMRPWVCCLWSFWTLPFVEFSSEKRNITQ